MSHSGAALVFETGFLVAKSSEGGSGVALCDSDYARVRAIALSDAKAPPFRVRTDSRGERIAVHGYVGIMALPSGQILEILPKCYAGNDALIRSRRALLRMVARTGPLPLKTLDSAAQLPSPMPLHRAIAQSFLAEVQRMLGRGLASSYTGIEAERRVLRGKIDVKRQMRLSFLKPDRFWTIATEYLEDRPENRLMRAALEAIRPFIGDESIQLYLQIAGFFQDIPSSTNIRSDFLSWSDNRLIAQYGPVKPWCRLILEKSAAPVFGSHSVPTLLFPMERLFESYVGSIVGKALPKEYRLVSQSRRHHLANRGNEKWFLMRPDYVVRTNGHDIALIDAKWKTLHQIDKEAGEPFDVAQADAYQLYAYGRHYLSGKGPLALAYPKTEFFMIRPNPYRFVADPQLLLHLIPIDLEATPVELLNFLHEALSAAHYESEDDLGLR